MIKVSWHIRGLCSWSGWWLCNFIKYTQPWSFSNQPKDKKSFLLQSIIKLRQIIAHLHIAHPRNGKMLFFKCLHLGVVVILKVPIHLSVTTATECPCTKDTSWMYVCEHVFGVWGYCQYFSRTVLTTREIIKSTTTKTTKRNRWRMNEQFYYAHCFWFLLSPI